MKLPWISRKRHKREMKEQRMELLGFRLVPDEDLGDSSDIEDWLERCEIRIAEAIKEARERNENSLVN